MQKIGAYQLLGEAMFRCYVELINRRAGKKVPNAFLQEVKGLHENTALGDLDKDFKKDIEAASGDFMTFLNHHGYKLVPKE